MALEEMQKTRSALVSALAVGAVWAVWHVPLFVMPGTYQASIGLGSVGFWLYMSVLPATSILITWFYNSSGSSVLAAIVYHLVNNLAGEILSLNLILEVVRVAGTYLAAILLLWYFGQERLKRS